MLRRLWLIFAQACTLILAALFVVQTLRPQWLRSEAPTPPPAGIEAGLARPPALAAASAPAATLTLAAARAAPAVVSIGTSGRIRSGSGNDDAPWHPFGNNRRGVGSGVIVDAEGFLLTNHHVIAGAQRIDVRLSDGREAEAELVGTDPETDLALLKLPVDKLEGLPVIDLGSSRTLQVGDAVLAIGNPFDVGQTVTSGIVSALQRQQLGINVFENFIQTDAAINPGNSGGALVDAQGRLVGINSAIYSRSGGSLGIGFAIPVELAQEVMTALRSEGRVSRGWMGVQTRELSSELVEALRLPEGLKGVLVSGVVQGAPASKAGVKPGDVMLAVGDDVVASPEALLKAVARLKPGSEVGLRLQRGAEVLQLKATVGQRPPPRS
jgi:Do/DeqQ family serine protease